MPQMQAQYNLRVELGADPRQFPFMNALYYKASHLIRVPTPHILCQTSRMKRFLAPILLMVFLFPSFALGLEMDDLVKRGAFLQGLYYEKFSDIPFSGKVTGLSQGSFKDGKRDGPWIAYYHNGQLWWKGTFKDGKKDGSYVSYYNNGQLGSKETYKDGNQDGLWVRYHDNGQLRSKGTYKDGNQDGLWVRYHDNGQLREKGTYKDGNQEGPWVSFNKDGTVNERWTGTFKNGVKVE